MLINHKSIIAVETEIQQIVEISRLWNHNSITTAKAEIQQIVEISRL